MLAEADPEVSEPMKNFHCWITASLIAASLVSAANPQETDKRVHADGKGWRLDRAELVDAKRPRVLLVGDSILNGYLSGLSFPEKDYRFPVRRHLGQYILFRH